MCLLYILVLASFALSKPISVVSSFPDSEFLYSNNPITLIFDHAVEPLGFEQSSSIKLLDLAENLVRGRWVTTSIYRFDPIQNWPLDLEVSLVVPEFLNFQVCFFGFIFYR